MPRTHAKLLTRIWHDDEFLARTATAQRVFMLAISQDTLNLCGVTSYSPRRWARFAADTTPSDIAKGVEELAETRFVVVDDDVEELWIRSFLKWDGVLDAPNSVVAMSRDFHTIYSAGIRSRVAGWMRETFPRGFMSYAREAFPKQWAKDQLGGIDDGFLHAIGEPIGEPKADGSSRTRGRSRARARSEAEAEAEAEAATETVPVPEAEGRSPKPKPARAVSHAGATIHDLTGNAGTGAKRNGTGTNTTGAQLELVHRVADLCSGDNRAVVNTEAAQVAVWALERVDPTVIDEAIGWCAKADTPPALPRAVAAVIEAKAADRGIRLPAFRPIGAHA